MREEIYKNPSLIDSLDLDDLEENWHWISMCRTETADLISRMIEKGVDPHCRSERDADRGKTLLEYKWEIENLHNMMANPVTENSLRNMNHKDAWTVFMSFIVLKDASFVIG